MIPADDERTAGSFRGLDTWPTGEILEALWASQARGIAVAGQALSALGVAVDGAAGRLAANAGRLVYAGAGSSGLLAAIDAVELGPTYNWPERRTLVFLAGGLDLVRGPDPAAEDDAAGGRARVVEAALGESDVVIGVSASGGSAYTVAVVEEARQRGALTIAIANRADSLLVRAADHAVAIATEPEVIAGSTRLSAGTVQKLVLNLFSTALMTRLGGVYDNLMIDVRPANAKLRQRQVAIVASIASVDTMIAADALARHGEVKRAVLGLCGLSGVEIDAALAAAGGNLRTALSRIGRVRAESRGESR